jgi:hypothetical protein
MSHLDLRSADLGRPGEQQLTAPEPGDEYVRAPQLAGAKLGPLERVRSIHPIPARTGKAGAA